jgi:hypothetical protein
VKVAGRARRNGKPSLLKTERRHELLERFHNG